MQRGLRPTGDLRVGRPAPKAGRGNRRASHVSALRDALGSFDFPAVDVATLNVSVDLSPTPFADAGAPLADEGWVLGAVPEFARQPTGDLRRPTLVPEALAASARRRKLQVVGSRSATPDIRFNAISVAGPDHLKSLSHINAFGATRPKRMESVQVE